MAYDGLPFTARRSTSHPNFSAASGRGVSEWIENAKKDTLLMEQQAQKEADLKKAKFEEEQSKLKEAWRDFTVANDNLKRVKQLLVAYQYESAPTAVSFEFDSSVQEPPPRPTAITARRKTNICRKRPLQRRTQSWTKKDVKRLHDASKGLDPALPGGEFYRELYRRYGKTPRSLPSVWGKARTLGIQPRKK